MWRGGRLLETGVIKNDTAVTFLSFLFCLIYPRLDDEVSNLEMSMPISQNAHEKLTFSSSMTRKVMAKEDINLLGSDQTILEKYQRKIL